MTILVTGSAGFIGSAVSLRLLEIGHRVIGIDNHNNYYDPIIKDARLSKKLLYTNYQHYRADITDQKTIYNIFKEHKRNIKDENKNSLSC